MFNLIVTYNLHNSLEREDIVDTLHDTLESMNLKKSKVKANCFVGHNQSVPDFTIKLTDQLNRFEWHKYDEIAVLFPLFHEIKGKHFPELGRYDFKIKGFSVFSTYFN